MICKFSSSILLKSMFWIVILWPRSTTALINITIKKGKKPLTEKTPFICSPFCRHRKCENLIYMVLGSRYCRKRALKPRFYPLLSRKFRARTRLRFWPFAWLNLYKSVKFPARARSFGSLARFAGSRPLFPFAASHKDKSVLYKFIQLGLGDTKPLARLLGA